MNIGIISDVHGDYKALEIVLDRLDNYHRVEQVLCAGDLVGRGPEPERVVDIIRERRIPTVRGNHDEWSTALSLENRAYLRGLPLDWRGLFDGTAVFMCHGKPGNNLWGLYRDHISDTLLNMMLGSLGAHVLVTGHTHTPLYVRVKEGCVINPGSLYTFTNARSSSHTYGVLRLPEMTFEVYDLTLAPGQQVRLSSEKPSIPVEHYTRDYFRRWNYANRGLGRFSMYWFARRYYAALVRRHAPPGGRLLEMGCGLGHLLGLLQDDFQCVGIDLIDYSIEQTRINAPKAEAYQMNADDLTTFESDSFNAVVALHLVEHLPDPAGTIRQVHRLLRPGGVFVFATPHPDYALRRFKDRDNDAIGKDKTHINVHPPRQWRAWCETSGFRVLRHFGDGLWDVPYLPLLPKSVQFGLFGLPALAQVVTRTTFTPLALGVNQIMVARKT